MRAAALICMLLLAGLAGCTSREARIAEQRKAADRVLRQEGVERGEDRLKNLLKLAPNDGEAHYQMAETLWNLQEYGESLWQYKEASRLAPDNNEWRLQAGPDPVRRARLRRLARERHGAAREGPEERRGAACCAAA